MIAWLALRVRHQCEAAVAEDLSGKPAEWDGVPLAPAAPNLEAFWPHRVTHDNHNRQIRRPWFPGYVFVKVDWEDLAQRIRLLRLPQLIQIVGANGAPAEIPESEIESLRLLARSRKPVSQAAYVEKGQRVRVTTGPLQGIEGMVVRFKNASVLVVQVEMLQRAVSVELDPETIEAVARRDLHPAVA